MARTRIDPYQIDPGASPDGKVMMIVGGEAVWADLPAEVGPPTDEGSVLVAHDPGTGMEWDELIPTTSGSVLSFAGMGSGTVWVAPTASGEVLTFNGSGAVWAASPPSGIQQGDFIFEETPSGAINDVNTSYMLAFAAAGSGCIALHLDGLRLKQGAVDDYVLASGDLQTITMNYPPRTGQNFLATYRK